MNDELDGKIAEYFALKPFRFPVVKSIAFTQGFDSVAGAAEMQQQVSLVFAKHESAAGELFRLDLFGVRNFVFEQPPLSLFCLYLNIEKNWDASKFDGSLVVFSSEQDVEFVCSCRDLVAIIVDEFTSE